MNRTEVARVLREASQRWALEFAAAGMPQPMPLSMYPDAWLRAEADRIDAEVAHEKAEREDAETRWLATLCERHDINPSTVLRDSVVHETSVKRMWRTKLEWPAGGTYEAATPRNYDDEVAATRTVTTLRLRVIGYDERGPSEPAPYGYVTTLTFTDETPWVFSEVKVASK
jgi:hypothetical protein